MIIRKMTNSDKKAVIDLQNRHWTASTSPVYDKTWTEKELDQYLAKGITFFIAETNNQIVGCLDLGPYYPFPAGKHVATFGILINKDYRGKGVGTALIRVAIAEAKSQGYHKLAIHVLGTNKSAISLYQKLGFLREACLSKAFCLEGQKVDALIFAKDLEVQDVR